MTRPLAIFIDDLKAAREEALKRLPTPWPPEELAAQEQSEDDNN